MRLSRRQLSSAAALLVLLAAPVRATNPWPIGGPPPPPRGFFDHAPSAAELDAMAKSRNPDRGPEVVIELEGYPSAADLAPVVQREFRRCLVIQARGGPPADRLEALRDFKGEIHLFLADYPTVDEARAIARYRPADPAARVHVTVGEDVKGTRLQKRVLPAPVLGTHWPTDRDLEALVAFPPGALVINDGYPSADAVKRLGKLGGSTHIVMNATHAPTAEELARVATFMPRLLLYVSAKLDRDGPEVAAIRRVLPFQLCTVGHSYTTVWSAKQNLRLWE